MAAAIKPSREGHFLTIRFYLFLYGMLNVLLILMFDSANFQASKILAYNEINVERLNTLEFTSDRKRMSTVVRDEKGDIWLYTKGAESHVFPLCQTTPSQLELIRTTQQHITDFAKIGLRTLAVARRKLTVEEYQTFDIGKLNFDLTEFYITFFHQLLNIKIIS